jgi:hypothetical protein
MHVVGFEATNRMFERAKTVQDLAAAAIGGTDYD